MKIDGFVTDVLNRYTKQTKAAEKNDTNKSKESTTVESSKTKDTDKVEISKSAKVLASLGSEENTEKSKRIEGIKIAYENNAYKPNVDKIATSILKEWKGE